MTMNNVRHSAERINIEGSIEFDVPMAPYTSFRVGGPAEIFIHPKNWQDVQRAMVWADTQGLSFFLLGGGANILVADEGIPGVVVHTRSLNGIEIDGSLVTAEAGAEISLVAESAAGADLTGLEFIFRMPGSVGGAVWMNARCYGVSLNERLAWVDLIDTDGRPGRYHPREEDFAYKKSPFQEGRPVITRAGFTLKPGSPEKIRALMDEHARDRESKGHFRYPSAGSVFKNDRAFGMPTGKLIDTAGLKGKRIGGAMIAPFHGNIIVNTGSATASDILALIRLAEEKVDEIFGFRLEREVLLVGAWSR
ncbi:UDP-N-acetylenolpyruvoylglucosamine reductase [Marispirochaeta aestuarii]|uniref:UDP-N-acetylenolpyruvoylglucosamine reductase n=2 Tax=Marispirochaeta aestuarii TaxID=1963862 RepID=A0A1Y1RUT2_9SPIO|nr:UDP-N-acetylenolpyruvoylglucosamine reductase [Marispirochaeta aestuarii]